MAARVSKLDSGTDAADDEGTDEGTDEGDPEPTDDTGPVEEPSGA
jgi:hypothetical protein